MRGGHALENDGELAVEKDVRYELNDVFMREHLIDFEFHLF